MQVDTKTLRQWGNTDGYIRSQITELGGGHLELATSTVGMPYSKLNLHRDCAKLLYLLLGEVLLSTEGEGKADCGKYCQYAPGTPANKKCCEY